MKNPTDEQVKQAEEEQKQRDKEMKALAEKQKEEEKKAETPFPRGKEFVENSPEGWNPTNRDAKRAMDRGEIQ